MTSRGGLVGFISRLGQPLPADSDADLLDRFVRSEDEAAFTGIVRRHGMMVLHVCRRRLRRDADAEDAFQAVFLALARGARAIGRRESLPGWLYRVAYLISLKAAAVQTRRLTVAWPEPELPVADPSPAPWETEELKAILDSELAALPDRFRAVVVLCLIEGHTNAEAAGLLGVPVGTVDSRLHTARRRLSVRLMRRGVAVGVAANLGDILGRPISAAESPLIQILISTTVRAVLAEAVGPGSGAVSPAVDNLARGISTMTLSKLRFAAAIGITVGLLGGAATGIILATAPQATKTADRQKASPASTTPNAPKPSADATAGAGSLPLTNTNIATPADAAEALDKPLKIQEDNPSLGVRDDAGVPLEDLFNLIEKSTGLIVRVDVAAFKRLELGANGGSDSKTLLQAIYRTQAILPPQAGRLPLRDLLSDALAQIQLTTDGSMCTYQVRGNQLVIVPAYEPPHRPGINPLNANQQGSWPRPGDEDDSLLSVRQEYGQIYGPTVSVQAEGKPLTRILADLRKQTGANIVLDPRVSLAQFTGRAESKESVPLNVSLQDVRLYDALNVIANMADLKMVYAGNIYYITTPENAKTFYPPSPTKVYVNPGMSGGLGGQVPGPATDPAELAPRPPAANPKPKQ